MTIRIEYGLSEDKKPELNTDPEKARFIVPHVVRINFIDDRNGALLFSFVPTFKQQKTMEEAFVLLNAYDIKRMDLFEFIKAHEIRGERDD